MTAVAGNNGLFSLGSLNDSTGWLPLFGIVDDPCFGITGTFVGTITLQTSNQSDAVKDKTSSIATYTVPVGSVAVPRIAARWFRLIMTAYTSGTAYVGVGKANCAGQDSIPVSLSPQMQTNSPVGDEF